MAAVVMATGTSRLMSKDTIYTAKLWRRGIDIEAAPPQLPDFRASQLLAPAPEPLTVRTSLAQAARALAGTSLGMLPVVSADGRYSGCVSAQDLAEALDEPDSPPTVGELTRPVATISADAGVREILDALKGHGGTGLPVLDSGRTSVVGWVTYETVLARLHPEPGVGSPQVAGSDE